MFELMAAFQPERAPERTRTFEEDGKVGCVRVLSPSRRPYKTSDGWVGVLPYTQRNWTKILVEISMARAWPSSTEFPRMPPSAAGASTSCTTSWPAGCQAHHRRDVAAPSSSGLDIPRAAGAACHRALLTDPHLTGRRLFSANALCLTGLVRGATAARSRSC